MSEDRDANGQFQPGHSIKSPGRPRRAIEVEYLKALSDEVSLDDWKEIVKAAKEAAKAGDAKAREWIASYVIGDKTPGLTDLALMDLYGATAMDWLAYKGQRAEELGLGFAGESIEGKERRARIGAKLKKQQQLQAGQE